MNSVLSFSPLARISGVAPVITRLIVGVIMAYHGYLKLTGGVAAYAGGMLGPLGVPAPTQVAYLQILAELGGGILLIIGLLTRVTAVVEAVILVLAIILVKTDIGLIGPMGAPLPGAELDLALIAGFISLILLGPGRPSVDHMIGIEKSEPDTVREGAGMRS